jgi:APA family basic amino acid/polyamine antiporter
VDRDRSSLSLVRRLGAFSGAMVVVGIVIGTGLYRVPPVVAAPFTTPLGPLVLWVAGGIVALAGALSVAELAATFPDAGGLYVYIREAFGPAAAFLFGWMWLLTDPISWAAQALVFSEYFGSLVGLAPLAEHMAAAALIVAIALVQTRSVGAASWAQNIFTSAKILTLGALAVALAVAVRNPAAANLPKSVPAAAGAGGVVLGLLAVLWAYDGWENLTALAGEVRDPGRNLPRALVGGTLVVILLYVGVNAGYLHVLGTAGVAASRSVAVDALRATAGGATLTLVALLVMVSVLGSLNGSMLSDPRVFYALARDGLFFRAVGRVHPRHRTPYVATSLGTFLAAAFVLTRSFTDLAAAYVLGIWPFLMLAVLALFRLRRTQPERPRPYRTWGYPFVPGLFLAASALVLLGALWQEPRRVALSVGLTALGLPIYYFWKSRGEGGTPRPQDQPPTGSPPAP